MANIEHLKAGCKHWLGAPDIKYRLKQMQTKIMEKEEFIFTIHES